MRIRSQWLTSLSAAVFTAAFRLLFRTLRRTFREDVPGTNPYSRLPTQRYLYCVWHDSMVMPAFGGRHHATAALASRHADGAFVTEVLRRLGVPSIRGSTNRISPGAMRQLLRATEDKHLVITPDGPRGPRRRITTGIAFLASRTGRAVVPTAYSCARCWRIRGSWTDLVIPKPFSRVFLLAGKPVEVPSNLGNDQLQPYVNLIQGEMDRLNEAAEDLAAAARSKRTGTSNARSFPRDHGL